MYFVTNFVNEDIFHDSVPNMVLQTPPTEVLSHMRADARTARLHLLRCRAKTVQVQPRTSTASQVLLRTVTATTGTNPRTGSKCCGTGPTCKDCSGTQDTRAAQRAPTPELDQTGGAVLTPPAKTVPALRVLGQQVTARRRKNSAETYSGTLHCARRRKNSAGIL